MPCEPSFAAFRPCNRPQSIAKLPSWRSPNTDRASKESTVIKLGKVSAQTRSAKKVGPSEPLTPLVRHA